MVLIKIFRSYRKLHYIIILAAIILQACSTAYITYDYPVNKKSHKKDSMGKFFKKDLIFKNNKYHKKEYKSREEFWSNIKEKIINKGFEIDFSDNELFFMTTKWKQHDEKNQVKINILLKNNYKNQNKNLSITATIRVKNKQDQWILSENQYLQNFYLGTVK